MWGAPDGWREEFVKLRGVPARVWPKIRLAWLVTKAAWVIVIRKKLIQKIAGGRMVLLNAPGEWVYNQITLPPGAIVDDSKVRYLAAKQPRRKPSG